MHTRHLIVIGASAGGIDALRVIAGALPAGFPAAVCVVVHVGPQSPGVLHEILSRAGPLTAVMARDRERLEAGRIYVAPPDHHLLIEPDRLRVTRGPKENRFRPAIDPLFRSAAQVYGPAAIGVILTGNLGDGTAGLWAIKQLGGVTVVQDPADALYPSMPRRALEYVQPDHRVPLAEIGPLLAALTAVPAQAGEGTSVPDEVNIEVNIAKEHHPQDAGLERIAHPSPYTCPECHGVLLKLRDAGPMRFRCHTGHAYSVESLLEAVHDGNVESLWNSIRSLEESGLLLRHLEHSGDQSGRDRLRTAAEDARRRSDVLRALLAELVGAPVTDR